MPAIVTSHKLRVGSAIVIQRLDTLVTFDVHPPSRPRFKAGFRMPDPTVRKRLPVGSPVQAMFDPETGATLFPAEFGKEIVLEG